MSLKTRHWIGWVAVAVLCFLGMMAPREFRAPLILGAQLIPAYLWIRRRDWERSLMLDMCLGLSATISGVVAALLLIGFAGDRPAAVSLAAKWSIMGVPLLMGFIWTLRRYEESIEEEAEIEARDREFESKVEAARADPSLAKALTLEIAERMETNLGDLRRAQRMPHWVGWVIPVLAIAALIGAVSLYFSDSSRRSSAFLLGGCSLIALSGAWGFLSASKMGREVEDLATRLAKRIREDRNTEETT